MGFKENHPEFQHLVRELMLLRQPNLRFKEGDPQDGLLFFAEAALVCLALERFVRAVLGADAGEKDTLVTSARALPGDSERARLR